MATENRAKRLILVLRSSADVYLGQGTVNWREIKPDSLIEIRFPEFVSEFQKRSIFDRVSNHEVDKYILVQGFDRRRVNPPVLSSRTILAIGIAIGLVLGLIFAAVMLSFPVLDWIPTTLLKNILWILTPIALVLFGAWGSLKLSSMAINKLVEKVSKPIEALIREWSRGGGGGGGGAGELIDIRT